MMELSQSFEEGLVVSCQAPEGSPMRDPYAMALMALSAEKAGAVGIRAEGAADIRAIADATNLPIIGIRKHHYPDSEVYITATIEDVDLVADAGAAIVALDATRRRRPGAQTLDTVIAHAHSRGLVVMADLSSADDAESALEAGADWLGTTLVPAGADDSRAGGPNLVALKALADRYPGHVIVGEGRFATADDVAHGFASGATSIVVGRAITDTYALARDLVAAAPRSRHQS